jgi:hypothetical protein
MQCLLSIQPSHKLYWTTGYRQPMPTRCGKNTAEAFGHWTLLWGHQVSAGLCWTHFNGLSSPCSQEAHRLAKAISNALGLDFHPPHSKSWMAQIDSNTCGTVALAHLFQLLNPGLMVPPTAIKLIHEWILAHPALQGSIFAQGLADLSTDQMAKLKQLLFDHGVPEAKVDERAKFVVQKLEAPAIIASFAAKNCWAQLKLAANKPGITIRLVLPDELARHAERMANMKYGAGISDHKREKKVDKTSLMPPQLDPAAVHLQAGHFKDEDDIPVPQIQ